MVEHHYRWDFIGLKDDVKPTPATSPKVTDGSTYYTSDDSKVYVWYKDQWYEKTDPNVPTPYTLPIATSDALGGIKVGEGLSIDSETGVLSADGGGSSVNVVQTTGSSTTDVMSQLAVTKMITPETSSTDTTLKTGSIAIGDVGTSMFKNNVAIGFKNQYQTFGPITTCSRGIAIVSEYSGDGTGIGDNGIYIGGSTTATSWVVRGSGSIYIGVNSHGGMSSAYAVALGYNAGADKQGSVALGANSRAQNVGEVNIGTSVTNQGFNSSNYRIIRGLYDGQDLHDAATLAQGNTLSTSAPTTSTVGVLGQLYTDTTNMHTYQCTAISGDTYTWTQRW